MLILQFPSMVSKKSRPGSTRRVTDAFDVKKLGDEAATGTENADEVCPW
jgi:hypothetical protein